MKKTLSIFAALGFSVLHISSVSAQEICVDILRLASHDTVSADYDVVIANDIYRNSCSNGSTKSSLTFNSGIDAVVQAIPFKAFFGGGTNKEKLESFCTNFTSSDLFTNKTQLTSTTVVREALTAFNSCIDISLDGLDIFPNVGLEFVNFDLVPRGQPIQLDSIRYNDDKMKCEVTTSTSATPIDALTISKISINDNISTPIICRRVGTKDGDTTRFEAAEIVIATSNKSFSMIIPQNAILPTQWASQIEEKIKAISELVAAQNGVEVLIDELKSGPESEYRWEFILEKPAILLVSGVATLERNPPTIANLQVDASIEVDENTCSRDYQYIGQASSITIKVAPSCSLRLLPGKHVIRFLRYDVGGNGNGARSEANVLVIAARANTK